MSEENNISNPSQAVTDLYRTCVDEIRRGEPALSSSRAVSTPRGRVARGTSQIRSARRLTRPHPYGDPGRRLADRGLSSRAIERPRVSYLEGVEGVEISGGNFVTTEGDYIGEIVYNAEVTINNFPGEIPSTTTQVVDTQQAVSGDSSSPLPIQRSCDLYNQHLGSKGRGFPLWIPEPNNNLPVEYRLRGIDIGDVGIIKKSGNFDFLFNICLPEDHPINRDGVPEGFSPCKPVRPSDIQRYTEFEAGAFLTSTSIDKSRYEGEYLNGTLVFESSVMDGAILTMPDGADTLELANVLHFERYMAKNVGSWYRYALVERGRRVENGEVRLVIGRDNARAWGMATFEKASTHGDALQLKFKPMEENALGSRRYTWEASGVALARTGPSRAQMEELMTDDNLDVTNQTLFVRTLNARLKNKPWRMLTSAIEQELMQLDDDHESQDISPENYASSPSSAGGPSTQAADGYSTSRENMVHYRGLAYLNSNPPAARIGHPSDRINELALENLLDDSDEITMIITKDTVWMSAVTKDDLLLPPAEELFKRIMKSNTLHINKEDGFLSFTPKSTPTAILDAFLGSTRSSTTSRQFDTPSTPPSSGSMHMPSAPQRVQPRVLFSVSDESGKRTETELAPVTDDDDTTLPTILDILTTGNDDSSAMPMSSAPSTPRRPRRYWKSPPGETSDIEIEGPIQNLGTDDLFDQLIGGASDAYPEPFSFPPGYEISEPSWSGYENNTGHYHTLSDTFHDRRLSQFRNLLTGDSPSTVASSTLSTPSTFIFSPNSVSASSGSASSGSTGSTGSFKSSGSVLSAVSGSSRSTESTTSYIEKYPGFVRAVNPPYPPSSSTVKSTEESFDPPQLGTGKKEDAGDAANYEANIWNPDSSTPYLDQLW